MILQYIYEYYQHMQELPGLQTFCAEQLPKLLTADDIPPEEIEL